MTRRSRVAHIRLLLMVVATSVLLTGCWDSTSLSNRFMVAAVVVEPTGRQGQLHWTFVIPNVTVTVSSLSSLSTQQQFFTLPADAPSLPMAVAAVQAESSRKLYLGHLRVVAWSPKLATPDVQGLLNDFAKTPNVPKLYQTVVGENLLRTFKTMLETVPDIFLNKYLSCSGCQPFLYAAPGWQVWSEAMTPGVGVVVPMASQPTVIDQLAVYQPGRQRPEIMGPLEAEGWAYLMGKVGNATMQVATTEGNVALQNVSATSNVHVSRNGEEIQVAAEIHARGVIGSMRVQHDIALEDKVRSQAAQAVLQRCIAAITWANRSGTDPFGFRRRLLWRGELSAQAASSPHPIRATVRVTFTIDGEGEI